jgi:hypothetical protein
MVLSANNTKRPLWSLPKWAVVLDAAAFAYVFINFGLCVRVTQGGGPEMINGQYFLTSHGHVLPHINEAQYHLQRAYQVRLFSDFWLLFYLMPTLYFLQPV